MRKTWEKENWPSPRGRGQPNILKMVVNNLGTDSDLSFKMTAFVPRTAKANVAGNNELLAERIH